MTRRSICWGGTRTSQVMATLREVRDRVRERLWRPEFEEPVRVGRGADAARLLRRKRVADSYEGTLYCQLTSLPHLAEPS